MSDQGKRQYPPLLSMNSLAQRIKAQMLTEMAHALEPLGVTVTDQFKMRCDVCGREWSFDHWKESGNPADFCYCPEGCNNPEV